MDWRVHIPIDQAPFATRLSPRDCAITRFSSRSGQRLLNMCAALFSTVQHWRSLFATRTNVEIAATTNPRLGRNLSKKATMAIRRLCNTQTQGSSLTRWRIVLWLDSRRKLVGRTHPHDIHIDTVYLQGRLHPCPRHKREVFGIIHLWKIPASSKSHLFADSVTSPIVSDRHFKPHLNYQ